jgi:hypothetical protein
MHARRDSEAIHSRRYFMYATDHPTHTHTLPGGQTRLIHAQDGLTLRVLAGRLWLTRPDDASDYFLKAGDCMELSGHGVLVQADPAPGMPGSDDAARFELVGRQPGFFGSAS